MDRALPPSEQGLAPVARALKPLLGFAAAGAALVALGIYLAATGSPLAGVALAAVGAACIWIGTLFGKASCPLCRAEVEVILLRDSRYNRCGGCWEYFELEGGFVRRMPLDHVADEPQFAVPLPWEDLRFATVPSFTPTATIKLGGSGRALQARWPESCCVCGAPAAARERVERLVLKPPQRVGSIVEERVTMAAEVPHCARHSKGARIDPEPGGGWVLKFRSYAFRNELKRLNGWK